MLPNLISCIILYIVYHSTFIFRIVQHSLHFGVRQYFFSCYVSISCTFGTAHDSLLCQDDERKDLVSRSLSDNPVDRFLGWLTDTLEVPSSRSLTCVLSPCSIDSWFAGVWETSQCLSFCGSLVGMKPVR